MKKVFYSVEQWSDGGNDIKMIHILGEIYQLGN